MYYLKKGNEFVTKNSKFSTVMEQGNKFNSTEEAENFFHAKFCDLNNAYDFAIYDENDKLVYNICEKEVYDDVDSLDMLEILTQAQEISKKLTYKISELNKNLSKHDKEVVDIYHYIEFNNLGASDGYKAYKLLQNTLRARRKDKNDIVEVEAARTVFSSSKIGKAIDIVVSNRNEKTYTPRVMEDLFKK